MGSLWKFVVKWALILGSGSTQNKRNIRRVSFYLELHLNRIFLPSSFLSLGVKGVNTVAVKTLKENATEIERNDLHSELQVIYDYICNLCIIACY